MLPIQSVLYEMLTGQKVTIRKCTIQNTKYKIVPVALKESQKNSLSYQTQRPKGVLIFGLLLVLFHKYCFR